MRLNIQQEKIGRLYSLFLVASYCYYKRFSDIMPDTDYDAIAKRLLKEWGTFEHQHKYLISKEDLKAGTAYAIKEYPTIVQIVGENIMLGIYPDFN